MESVREARARYFAESGLSEAGYRQRWFVLQAGPLRLPLPNVAARRRLVPLHDLHHVATGYPATWIGEAEIGAWEIAAGCGPHWIAWALNGSAALVGLVLAPRRVVRAFRRGLPCQTLYGRAAPESLLELTVEELRRRVGLGEPLSGAARSAGHYS